MGTEFAAETSTRGANGEIAPLSLREAASDAEETPSKISVEALCSIPIDRVVDDALSEGEAATRVSGLREGGASDAAVDPAITSSDGIALPSLEARASDSEPSTPIVGSFGCVDDDAPSDGETAVPVSLRCCGGRGVIADALFTSDGKIAPSS